MKISHVEIVFRCVFVQAVEVYIHTWKKMVKKRRSVRHSWLIFLVAL